MTVHNIHEKRDQELKEIWLANAEEFDDLMTENFGESDDADESDDSELSDGIQNHFRLKRIQIHLSQKL